MFGLLTLNETAKSNDNGSALTSGNMESIFGAVRFYNNINNMSQIEEYNSVRWTNLAINILSTNA